MLRFNEVFSFTCSKLYIKSEQTTTVKGNLQTIFLSTNPETKTRSLSLFALIVKLETISPSPSY